MNEEKINNYLNKLKLKYKVHIYTPFKYFEGLKTLKEIESRFLEMIDRRYSDYSKSESYKPFKTDLGKKTKKSNYTLEFEKMYGDKAKSLEEKAKATGIPLEILEEVFRKGKAAWRTGHRVGTTEDQWGYARVHSFIMLGCTAFGSDFYLVKKAVPLMKKENVKKWFSSKILCPETTLEKNYYKKFNAKQFITKK